MSIANEMRDISLSSMSDKDKKRLDIILARIKEASKKGKMEIKARLSWAMVSKLHSYGFRTYANTFTFDISW